MDEVLEVQHVKKFFGNKIILDDVNFSLGAGQRDVASSGYAFGR